MRAFILSVPLCCVNSLRRTEGGCSTLLNVVRGAVKLVWHPLLCGFFQVTDSLALVVLWSLRHAPRRHCLKAQQNKPKEEVKSSTTQERMMPSGTYSRREEIILSFWVVLLSFPSLGWGCFLLLSSLVFLLGLCPLACSSSFFFSWCCFSSSLLLGGYASLPPPLG